MESVKFVPLERSFILSRIHVLHVHLNLFSKGEFVNAKKVLVKMDKTIASNVKIKG